MQTQAFKLKIPLSGMWDLRGNTLIVHGLHISFYFFNMCVCVSCKQKVWHTLFCGWSV